MNLKNVVLLAAIAAAVVLIVLQRASVTRARSEISRLRDQLAAVPEPAPPPIVPNNSLPDAERIELLRLRGEVAQLRREREDLSRRLAAKSNAVKPSLAVAGTPDQAWITQMLSAPPAQQGALAGAVRGKMLRGGKDLTASELALRDALAQRDMNSLERTPNYFSDFQAAFIENAVGLTDAEKMQQIRDVILRTYEHAVANGLDIPSKPATGAEDWVTQRHQLDRRATSAVQKVLTPEERQAFDRAFLGVMGIDLGTGVDKSNYPRGFLGD